MYKKSKAKRKNKSNLGPDFVAPDGGWGWAVCIALGVSNFSSLPILQQFGLVCRERLFDLGLTASQITTLINVHLALGACSGLFNGPMFRRFSYRQVAFASASLVVLGVAVASVADSFMAYFISFAVMHGIGLSVGMSAGSLALNTYFNKKRRIATGISCSLTALGYTIVPHLINYLLSRYGVQGTVLLLSAIALHSVAASIIYQPVRYHIRKSIPKIGSDNMELNLSPELCKYCQTVQQKPIAYEITNPGTPMLSRANDGWFSGSPNENKGSAEGRINVNEASTKNSLTTLCSSSANRGQFLEMQPLTIETSHLKDVAQKLPADKSICGNWRNSPINEDEMQLKCSCVHQMKLNRMESKRNAITDRRRTFMEKIVIFFDLDLLRDFGYLNLVVGLTVANFAETNFSLLIPFVLADFGFADSQIALALSVLGIMDLTMRFIVPFLAEKLGWRNRTFFLLGALGMAVGRIIIAYVREFNLVLVTVGWIGLNKAMRTVFMNLIIPSYVSLDRLPAASGLYLLFVGIFTFSFGPIIGWIRDTTNYVITLHCLNVATLWTTVTWGLEDLYWKCKKPKIPSFNEAS